MNDWFVISTLLTGLFCCAMSSAAADAGSAGATVPAEERVEKVIDVAPVWAGHPVGFALLTHKDRQFVAFYDDQRRMTVGARKRNEDTWRLVRLPETVGWDSHNYITMTVDDDGYLHLSGNLH